MTFGEKLQKLRRGSGLSQEQLAEKLDVTRQAVSKWELGDSLPDAGRILTLSRLFDVSTDAANGSAGASFGKEEAGEGVPHRRFHHRRAWDTGFSGDRRPVQHDRIFCGHGLYRCKRNDLVHQRFRILFYGICGEI